MLAEQLALSFNKAGKPACSFMLTQLHNRCTELVNAHALTRKPGHRQSHVSAVVAQAEGPAAVAAGAG